VSAQSNHVWSNQQLDRTEQKLTQNGYVQRADHAQQSHEVIALSATGQIQLAVVTGLWVYSLLALLQRVWGRGRWIRVSACRRTLTGSQGSRRR